MKKTIIFIFLTITLFSGCCCRFPWFDGPGGHGRGGSPSHAPKGGGR
jgi:hypothetical protein